MSQVKAIQCPYCNSPIDVSPEDAIFNCKACGQAILADGSKFENHYILENTLNKDQVNNIVKAFIKKKGFLRGIRGYKITKVDAMLLPFWVVTTDAYTHFVGYLRYTETESRTVGSGKNRRTVTESVTVYRPIDKEIREKRADVLLGRRGSSIFGYERVKEILKTQFQYAVHFNQEKLLSTEKDFKYLSSEISMETANQLGKTIVFDDHRARAEKACTKVFDCATQITYTGTYFVHVPVFEVEYVFKDETYRLAILGSNGQVIIGEIPVTTRFRIIFLTLTFLFFIGGAAGSYFMRDGIPPTIILGLIASVIGFFTLRNTFKPVSVFRG
ncbi:MAG: hypothetical protein ACTSUR_01130 [Candidatus Heimdallarchaeaceae archaeon]